MSIMHVSSDSTDSSEYLNYDLRAHTILGRIPIHDVWRLDLPGGGEGRTTADIRTLALEIRPDFIVRTLFAFRRMLGHVFFWDKVSDDADELFQDSVTEEDQLQSLVTPGIKDGPFTVLYVHKEEAMSEIHNRTVHAALVWVLKKRKDGYRLYWAIYVKPVSRFTAIYMILIDPFRKLIVYPSLLHRLHKSWCRKYNSGVE